MKLLKKIWLWLKKEYGGIPEYCKVSCEYTTDPNEVNPFAQKRPEQR